MYSTEQSIFNLNLYFKQWEHSLRGNWMLLFNLKIHEFIKLIY